MPSYDPAHPLQSCPFALRQRRLLPMTCMTPIISHLEVVSPPQVTVDNISAALHRCGYQSRGWEVMYNGHTGRQLQAQIFLNPTYYQRLKHMVRAGRWCNKRTEMIVMFQVMKATLVKATLGREVDADTWRPFVLRFTESLGGSSVAPCRPHMIALLCGPTNATSMGSRHVLAHFMKTSWRCLSWVSAKAAAGIQPACSLCAKPRLQLVATASSGRHACLVMSLEQEQEGLQGADAGACAGAGC